MYHIDRFDDYGRGITYVDDKVTFVDGAIDQEDVEIEVITQKHKYNNAKVSKVINASSERIDNDCPYYKNCGGCHLRHMSYNKELDFKCKRISNILKKFSNIDIDNIEIVYDKEYSYRNKVTLQVKNKKLGLIREGTNEIVNIDKCLILNDEINKVIEKLNNINLDGINKIVIKLGNVTNEIMLSIYGNAKNIDSYKDISNSLIINDKVITNEYITSYILNKKFHIRYDSFFQVNSNICEKLYSEIINVIKNTDSKKVIDLYSGVGTIGILVSDYVDEVLCVEIVENAFKDSIENKEINNISNIKFINNSVENIVDVIKEYDTVIVDPPRKGLDKKTINTIVNTLPKNIIYVSCDSITLARDLNILKEYYNINNIKLFNMFPRTYHCESVCILERR